MTWCKRGSGFVIKMLHVKEVNTLEDAALVRHNDYVI